MAKAAPGYTQVFARALAEAGLNIDPSMVHRVELTVDAHEIPRLVVTSYVDPDALDKVVEFLTRRVTFEPVHIEETRRPSDEDSA